MRDEGKREGKYSIIGKALNFVGDKFTHSILGKLIFIFYHSILVILVDIKNRRVNLKPIIQQTYAFGIEAIPFIAIIALVLGALTIIQALTVMPKVGFGDFFGNLMIVVINRELGPIITAFIIAGRTGSSLATYISYMKVNSEIDALETMGINPYRHLIMPSIIGTMLAVLTCTIIFNATAIFAGFLVVKSSSDMFQNVFNLHLQWDIYYISLLDAISWADLIMTIVKPLVFGAIIATSAIYYGMEIKNDIRAVPKSTSNSVVQSFILIVISNIGLSTIYIFEYITKFTGML